MAFVCGTGLAAECRRPTVGSSCSSFASKAWLADRKPRARAVVMMAKDPLIEDAESRMSKTVETVKANFSTVRTGRANAQILDRVVVSYYGADTPLNQMASISTPSSNILLIDPYDKTAIADIERGIMEADLGMNPNSDGTVIRLNVPQLTQDRRKEFVKSVKALAEDGRVAIRNIRRDAIDKFKKQEKDGELSKDESKSNQDAVQKLTNKFIKSIDGLSSEKEADIMKV